VGVELALAPELARGVLATAQRGRPAYVDHGSRGQPRVALSFDDGPGALTADLLEVLGAHSARATFNVLGKRVSGREPLLRRALADGHELGSHAWRHERLGGRPFEALRQLLRTNAALRRATGRAPRVFRAPYGEVSAGVVRAARAAGLVTVGWDVDPRDYETPGAAAIHDRVAAAVRPGSIVLLHDDRRALGQTVVATERILDTLAGRGLGVVTVSELLGLGAPGARRSTRRSQLGRRSISRV
jgi:peptidoglycan/xylan/chitin deacetylase (PgdA/CDA1 family)